MQRWGHSQFFIRNSKFFIQRERPPKGRPFRAKPAMEDLVVSLDLSAIPAGAGVRRRRGMLGRGRRRRSFDVARGLALRLGLTWSALSWCIAVDARAADAVDDPPRNIAASVDRRAINRCAADRCAVDWRSRDRRAIERRVISRRRFAPPDHPPTPGLGRRSVYGRAVLGALSRYARSHGTIEPVAPVVACRTAAIDVRWRSRTASPDRAG